MNYKLIFFFILIFSKSAFAQLDCIRTRGIIGNSGEAHYSAQDISKESISKISEMFISITDSSKIILTEPEYKALLKKMKNKKYFKNFKSQSGFNLIFSSSKLYDDYKKNGCNFIIDLKDGLLKGLDRQNRIFAKVESYSKEKIDSLNPKIEEPKKRFKNEKELNKFLEDYFVSKLKQNKLEQTKKLTENIKKFLSEEYFEIAIQSYLKTLDPHSDYFDADKMKEFSQNSSNILNGFGFMLLEDPQGEGLLVHEVFKDSPALKSDKIKVGDVITSIDETNIKNLTFPDMIQLMKKDTIEFGLKGQKEKVKLTKDTFSFNQIESKLIKKDNFTLFYARPKSFYTNTNVDSETGLYSEFKSAFKEASKDKIDIVIMDLRNNPGGYVDEAVKLAGLFIGNNLVVKEVSNNFRTKDYVAYNQDEPDFLIKQKLIVLTNHYSASASEIFAGVMKDYNRGLVVGDSRTYGKGSMQEILDFERIIDGGGYVKITKSLYFLPSGNTPQLKGITSDIIIPSSTESGDNYEDNMINVIKENRKIDLDGVESFHQLSPETLVNLKSKSESRVKAESKFKDIPKITEDTVLSEVEQIAIDYLKENKEVSNDNSGK